MNEITTERTLEVIASEINIIRAQTQQVVLTAAIEVGKRLVEAKASVEQGQWGKWLADNVDYSERKAQELMRVFQEYGQGQKKLFGEEIKGEKMSALSYSQAVALLAIKDSDERAEFINNEPVEDMSTRELKDEIAKRKAVEEEMSAVKAENSQMREEKAAAENRISELEGAMKDAEQMKAEAEQLKEEAEKSKEQLSEMVQKSNDASKKVLELQQELKAAEEKLKEQPEPAVVYDMTDAQKAEMESLREKLKEAENKVVNAQRGDKALTRFAVHFDTLKETFNMLLVDIAEMESEDDRKKYKGAVKKLTEIIMAKVGEELTR